MAEVTATIGGANGAAVARAARAMQDDRNGPLRMDDMNAVREVKYWIYIFNVGPMEHIVGRNWATNGRIIIPACEPGKPYSHPYILPDVVQVNRAAGGSNELSFIGQDGKRFAQDVLNPDDPMGDWKTVRPINQGTSTNVGTNLYNWGCFWTLNNPPEKEALAKATQRRNDYLNSLIAEAETLWIAQQDPKYNGDRVGKTHHTAAEFLGIETAWHRHYRPKFPCPGCGELLHEGVAICSKCPAVFDWDKAIQYGLRKPEDRPSRQQERSTR